MNIKKYLKSILSGIMNISMSFIDGEEQQYKILGSLDLFSKGSWYITQRIVQ